jgi:hypothetical protein
MEIKEVIFQSNIAFDEWKKRNGRRVQVISISSPEIIVGYNVSRALINPNIRVTYREFPE